jgi:hypothetical protein
MPDDRPRDLIAHIPDCVDEDTMAQMRGRLKQWAECGGILILAGDITLYQIVDGVIVPVVGDGANFDAESHDAAPEYHDFRLGRSCLCYDCGLLREAARAANQDPATEMGDPTKR